MELLTPVLQYLSSGACQENLLKAVSGFKDVSNRCCVVHERRLFLINTPLRGNFSWYWRLKTFQIINFSCFSQVHGAKVKIVKIKLILLLERQEYTTPAKTTENIATSGNLASGFVWEQEVCYVWSSICNDKHRRFLRCSRYLLDFTESVKHRIPKHQV